jgi:polar amino acid transport system ATP-binding protein
MTSTVSTSSAAFSQFTQLAATAQPHEANAMPLSHSAQPLVSFKDVTKRYGSFTVLDKLNLDVAPGEKVAIIGPRWTASR